MFEERDVRMDLTAMGVAVVVVFLALALFTYHPSDPPVELVYPFDKLYVPDVLVDPPSETTANACGRWGSLAASLLLEWVGIGAYYLVGSLGIVAVLMLMRRKIDAPLTRFVGWLVSLVGLSTLSSMLVPWLTPGPVIGSGGYLGALGTAILESHFASIGGFILAGSLCLAGVMLCTDYFLLHLLLICSAFAFGRFAQRWGGALPIPTPWARGSRRTLALAGAGVVSQKDREDGDDDDDDEAMAVRIRGKRIGRNDLTVVPSDIRDDELDDVDQESDGEYAEDEEDDFDEADEELETEGDEEVADEDDESSELAVEPAASSSTTGARLLRAGSGRRRLAAPAKPIPAERDEVMQQLDAASSTEDVAEYELPSLSVLDESDDFCVESQEKEVRRKAKILEETFQNFGYNVKVVEVETGPVIAQYEVQLEAGLRLSKITGLADDLAIALRVPSVRIVAPIPGKNTVGIEVPNEQRQLVRLREVMQETNGRVKKMRIPLFLGKDVSGNALTVDLSTLPHLLIAGRTGTGKSVCLNAIIASILMTRRPDEVRMLMIDPKMVELSGYKSLPHLMHPVVTDMRKAEAILAWAVDKMEERYEILARAGVRHVSVYNQLGKEELMERMAPETDEERQAIPLHMPFIVIVADEMADLMMTAGKEVEQHIIRLAQKSRAVGIHLILATQKPTVDVITGLIKSNLPARIAFQVASRTDSRVVLDEMGADKLLGNGDMLFLWPGTSTLLRGQGTYLSDEEINRIVDAASTGEQDFVNELVHLKVDDGSGANTPGELKNRDELYEQAIEIVIREGRGSLSLLQRALGIGYGRAARLVDFMAEDGIVGTYAGSQAREVLLTMEDWQRMKSGGATPPTDTEPPAKSTKSTKSMKATKTTKSTKTTKLNKSVEPVRSVRSNRSDAPWENDSTSYVDDDAEEDIADEDDFEEDDFEEDDLVDDTVDDDEIDEEDDVEEDDVEDYDEDDEVSEDEEDEEDDAEEDDEEDDETGDDQKYDEYDEYDDEEYEYVYEEVDEEELSDEDELDEEARSQAEGYQDDRYEMPDDELGRYEAESA
ncbi:MAG: DNA translocase FtsK 4TM domain-containing protein [Pirellulaceae bacterium]|nr:DNA translocase FtsK 4TM domain-containing protein [Planctomycetales bacterium]